jgi:hypothetical protein
MAAFNVDRVKDLISLYNDKLDYVLYNKEEEYKWKAVSHFQQNWSDDIAIQERLNKSLELVYNLMDGGAVYRPKTHLLQMADAEPDTVEGMISALYDTEVKLTDRLKKFKKQAQYLNEKYRIFRNNRYANIDDRAAMVLLCCRYPSEYYLYKYEMYNDFAHEINYSISPIKGRESNVIKFSTLCRLIKPYLIENLTLIESVHERLGELMHIDGNYNILTQDFIYCCVEYLPTLILPKSNKRLISTSVDVVASEDVAPIHHDTDQKKDGGVNKDYIAQAVRNQALGKAGELFVLEYEIQKLLDNGKEELAGKIVHTADERGDGFGYDIESRNLNGEKIYIEVKCTSGKIDTPFYITENERNVSQKKKNSYRLYRVYDFDFESMQGNIQIITGDLTPLCQISTGYKCQIKIREN